MLVGTILGLAGLLLGATSGAEAAFDVAPVEAGVSSEISVGSSCGDDGILLVVSAGTTVWDVARFEAGGSPVLYDLAVLPEEPFADVALAVSCEDRAGALSSSTCFAVIFGDGGAVFRVEAVSCDGVVLAPSAPAVFEVAPVDPGVSSEISVTSTCGDTGFVVVPPPFPDGVQEFGRFGPGESPVAYALAEFWAVGFVDVCLAVSCEDPSGTLSSSTCFAVIFGPGGTVAFVESLSCDGLQVAPPFPPPPTTTTSTTTAPRDDQEGPPTLPETGTSTRRLVTIGMLLIVAGGSALLLNRTAPTNPRLERN